MDGAAGPDPGPARALAWDDARTAFRRPLLALAVLSCVAGIADGVSLTRDGVFVANQSGNLVHIGMGLAGQFGPWPEALVSVVAFGAGAALAHAWSQHAPAGRLVPPARILLAAGLVVLAYTVLVSLDPGRGGPWPPAMVALSALGMGALAVVVVRTGAVRSTTTYQTGTVIQTSERLLALADSRAWRRGGLRSILRRDLPVVGLTAMGAYVLGGLLGALALRHSTWWLLLSVAGVLALLAELRCLRVPPPSDPGSDQGSDRGSDQGSTPGAGEPGSGGSAPAA